MSCGARSTTSTSEMCLAATPVPRTGGVGRVATVDETDAVTAAKKSNATGDATGDATVTGSMDVDRHPFVRLHHAQRVPDSATSCSTMVGWFFLSLSLQTSNGRVRKPRRPRGPLTSPVPRGGSLTLPTSLACLSAVSGTS